MADDMIDSETISSSLPPHIKVEPTSPGYRQTSSTTSINAGNNTDVASHGIKNGGLQATAGTPVDTIHLTVPQLKSHLPCAAWRTGGELAEKDLLNELATVGAVPLDLDTEENMKWTPLPSNLKNPSLNEKIEGGMSIDKYVSKPNKITTSLQMLWKKPGLRCLDDTEEEEDEDLTEDPELLPKNSESLLQPWAGQVRAEEPGSCHERAVADTMQTSKSLQPVVTASLRNLHKSPIPWTATFSAHASLHDFLDLRGQRFKRPKLFHGHSKEQLLADPIQATPAPAPVLQLISRHDQDVQVPATQAEAGTESLHAALPASQELSHVRTIMLNSQLLKTHKKVIMILETQGDDKLKMVYRDFSENKLLRQEAFPDILLSSSACVIFSNFQALIQKSLPGMTRSSSQLFLHDKIRALCTAYEKIFVLMGVRQSNLSAGSPDVDKITCFCAFTHSLNPTAVQPIWVDIESIYPKGVDPYASWTWALIIEYAFPRHQQVLDHDWSFLQDETMWEVLLQRAGMNLMSSQIVLGTLNKQRLMHRPGAIPENDAWGLRRFVQMSLEEKVVCFKDVVTTSQLETAHNFFNLPWT